MISAVSPNSHRGRFITFEGLDGCGKSTQLEKLAGVLRAQGLSVVVTREPGGTATGEKIRRLLLDTATDGLSPMAELALMFASRAQHIAEVIQPALADGKVSSATASPTRPKPIREVAASWAASPCSPCIASCVMACSLISRSSWIPTWPQV